MTGEEAMPNEWTEPGKQPASAQVKQIAQTAGTAAGAAMATAFDVSASMGLTGWAKQLAGLGVVGFLCLAFWAMQRDFAAQGREDRAVFREAVEVLRRDGERQARDHRSDSERQWQATKELTAAVKQAIEARPKEDE